MQELALKIIKPFVGALLILALLFIARHVGYTTGYGDASAEHQKADIAALNNSIVNLNVAVKKADAASLAIAKSINDRVKADEKTTKQFSAALASTAHLRVGCNFDDNILRQVYEAADRADKATTSGIVSTVPARAAPSK